MSPIDVPLRKFFVPPVREAREPEAPPPARRPSRPPRPIMRESCSPTAEQEGQYTLPVRGRLFYEPGSEIRVPYYAPGAREGVGVTLHFQHPLAWTCGYGCKGLEAVRGDGTVIITATHLWDCDYWYTPEGKHETPF